jgi:uncharacterized integral membrane protein
MGIVHRADDRDERREDGAPEAGAVERLTPEQQRRRTMAKVVVALALLVLFILFITWNTDPVDVSFVFGNVENIPLVWVFLGCALVGALVAYLLGRPGRRATRKYIKELERRLKERE